MLAIAIISLASCDCGKEKNQHEIAESLVAAMTETESLATSQDRLPDDNEFAFTVPGTVCGYMQRNTGGYCGPVHCLKSGRTLNSTTRKIESQAVIKNGKMADGTGRLYDTSCRIDRFPSGYNSENHHFIALGKIII